MRVLRWLVAVLLVAGALAVVRFLQPTVCRGGDMCSDNIVADVLIVLTGVVPAALVLTVRRRRDLP
jgi:hypothetical protein